MSEGLLKKSGMTQRQFHKVHPNIDDSSQMLDTCRHLKRIKKVLYSLFYVIFF